MYLLNTEKLQIKSNVAATTTEPSYVVSYNSFDAGLLDPLSGAGLLSGTTEVDVVGDPGASLSYQVKVVTVCNQDTVSHTITVYKDVSGTNRQIAQALLQAGETLQYDGALWSVFSQSTQSATVLREYIANDTWTKPAGLKGILACAVGAGGAGGSGARNAAGTNRFGGSAGGSGSIRWRYFTASELTATVAITIGTGGTGGTGQTADNSGGNNGTAGTDTSFGAFLVASGGTGGPGAAATAAGGTGAGGLTSTGTPTQGPYALVGNAGPAGQTTSASTGSTGFNGFSACPSGAGGGGINNGNTSSTATYTGGSIINNGVTVSGGTFGQNGTDNVARSLLFHPSLTGSYGIGTGGGGGRPDDVDGGNGGNYGASGGGGSGVLNGTTSGAGGNGAGGLLVMYEFY